MSDGDTLRIADSSLQQLAESSNADGLVLILINDADVKVHHASKSGTRSAFDVECLCALASAWIEAVGGEAKWSHRTQRRGGA